MVLVREYSVRALYLPYFMCGRCRLIYIDKNTIRQSISAWRDAASGPKNIPYEELYKEMMRNLEEVVEYYCRTAGYKRARFKRKLA
jgi:hypothetical protein